MTKKIFIIIWFIIVFSNLTLLGMSALSKKVEVAANLYLEGQIQITSDKYILQNKYIKAVAPQTERDSFLSSFQLNNAALDFECYNVTGYVGTGCALKVNSNNSLVNSYEVVVAGDVTGDGDTSITDVVKIVTYSEKMEGLNKEVYMEAADLNNDKKISREDGNSLAYYTIRNLEVPVLDNPTKAPNIELLSKTIILEKGSQTKIEARIDQGGSPIIEWKSSNEKIAVVDKTGLITGLDGGTASITATTISGESVSVEVNVVVIVPPTGIMLDVQTLNMKVGSTQRLTAAISPANATDQTVSWKSGDSKVATVDTSGKVTAHNVGTTIITATTSNGFSATVEVVVSVPVSGVELDTSSVTLEVGESKKIVATIAPLDATNKKVTWSSDRTEVATIEQDGTIKAIATGTAVITVTTADGNYKAECKVTVSEQSERPSLSLSKSTITLADEHSFTITATILPDTSSSEIVWTSDDSSIAIVNNQGKVTGKSIGTTTITAKLRENPDIYQKCKVTVRKIEVLMVGNSKTYKGDLPIKFQEIAKDGGYETTVTWFTDTGGKTLATDYSLHESEIAASYDYAIFQEQTDAYSSADSTTFYLGVSTISKAVKGKNSKVKLFIRKTWVLNDSDTTTINRAYSNVSTVISKIKTENNYSIDIINDGPSLYYALNNHGDITIFSDDRHQSSEGAYLAASCIYATIFQQDPTKISYKVNFSTATADVLKTIAKEQCYTS